MPNQRGPTPRFKREDVPEKLRPYVMEVHGQPYMTAAGYLLMFREKHPNGVIDTYLIEHGTDYAIFRAVVGTPGEGPSGYQILGTGHSMETVKGFADFLPKAETMAVRRAIINAGIGVEYMEESGEIVDAPQASGEQEPQEEMTEEEQRRLDAYKAAFARLRKIAKALNRGSDNASLQSLLYEYLPDHPKGTKFTTSDFNSVAEVLERELTG